MKMYELLKETLIEYIYTYGDFLQEGSLRSSNRGIVGSPKPENGRCMPNPSIWALSHMGLPQRVKFLGE
jgi:hypothetical protein